jgi:four helix bundle protein
MKESFIKKRSFEFAVSSIDLYKKLLEKNEYVLSKQFLKSSTSIGANVEEALAGMSKRDFISKMSIASKEARETRYWICLMERTEILEYNYNPLKKEIDEIISMLTSIVKTSQLKLNKK